MHLVWQKPRLRLAGFLLALASIVIGAGAWLPLGIGLGLAREVPQWSRCGQALCTCLPTNEADWCGTPPEPASASCPLHTTCAPSVALAPRAENHARRRLDLTPVGQLRNKFAFLGGFFLVGVLGTEAVVKVPPLNDSGVAMQRLALAPPTRLDEIPTPPPRA